MVALAHGHGTCIKIIISINLGLILSSTLVHVSLATTGQPQVTLKCTKRNGKFVNWSQISHVGKCTNNQHILVTEVYAYDQHCYSPKTANEMTKRKIERICNGKTDCTVSELDIESCETNACYLLYFNCTAHNIGYTVKDVTSTQHSGLNEHMEADDSGVDMHLIIIVVVSLLAFVAIVFVATLCLLFFFCQKSPLYRRRTISHRTAEQQHQPEYDDVAENKFQTLTPSVEDVARHHGVFCVNAPGPTTSRAYANRITSDYDDYDEISSNESPEPAKRTISAREISPPLPTIPLQSELMTSARSNARSSQPADKHSSLSSHQDRQARPPLETPNEYTNTLRSSTSHTSKASSTEPMSPVNAEDSVSVTHGHLTIVEVQPGVYRPSSPTSYMPVAEAAACHSRLSVTGDYAHLTRSGEEPRILDNVYDG
ncbi:hypothetical protein BsWGS_28063 [Bradybaena similaris]